MSMEVYLAIVEEPALWDTAEQVLVVFLRDAEEPPERLVDPVIVGVDPDIVVRALQKAGTTADRAVMVGDSVWDMFASARANVTGIGVLSGGFGREELLSAGAVVVYDDLAHLFRDLDSSLIAG